MNVRTSFGYFSRSTTFVADYMEAQLHSTIQ